LDGVAGPQLVVLDAVLNGIVLGSALNGGGLIAHDEVVAMVSVCVEGV
jgi:hypothetical protein